MNRASSKEYPEMIFSFFFFFSVTPIFSQVSLTWTIHPSTAFIPGPELLESLSYSSSGIKKKQLGKLLHIKMLIPKSLAHQGMAPGHCCNTEVQLPSDYSLMGSPGAAFIDLCCEVPLYGKTQETSLLHSMLLSLLEC